MQEAQVQSPAFAMIPNRLGITQKPKSTNQVKYKVKEELKNKS